MTVKTVLKNVLDWTTESSFRFLTIVGIFVGFSFFLLSKDFIFGFIVFSTFWFIGLFVNFEERIKKLEESK